jgi:hypothetical protein
MDELVERVRQTLAAEYPGAPNGRVRDVPDRRAIRWYTTTGLVDRPLGMQHRSAVYGPRHLLQVVAVKRRQAQGHSLAAIQAELTGASDADLAAVARVPAAQLAASPSTPDAGAERPRFWAAAPAAAATEAGATAEAGATDGTTATDGAGAAAASLAASMPSSAAGSPAAAAPAPAAPAPAPPSGAPPAATEVGGIALGGGAILVLPVRPSTVDFVELTAAAQPLIHFLVEHGLLHTAVPGLPHDRDLLTHDDRSTS